MLRQDRNYQRMAQWISSKSARRWCMALLHSPDLHSAAASLRKHYFDTDGYAAWCGGVDLNMNGSYSGSQSQESWHRHVLRPSLEHMKRPVEQVIERLNLLVKSRHEQASLRLRSLEDCPARMWSRKLVVEGEAILQKPAIISTATATVAHGIGIHNIYPIQLPTSHLHPQWSNLDMMKHLSNYQGPLVVRLSYFEGNTTSTLGWL